MSELTTRCDGEKPRAVYREGGASVVARIGGFLLIAYTIYVVIEVARLGKFGIVVFLIVAISPLLAIVARVAVAGAWWTHRGIHVRNIRGTSFVPWEEIERFTVGAHGILPKVGFVERRDGERIVMWGIQGPNPAARPNNRAVERAIERLNSELHERRASDDQCGVA